MFNFKNFGKGTSTKASNHIARNIAGIRRHFDATYNLRSGIGYTANRRTYRDFATDGYINNVIANRAINLIARSAISTSIIFQTETVAREIVELYDHPVIDLLRRPNVLMNYHSFLECIIKNILISGNCYVQCIRDGTGSVSELYVLRGDRMSVVPGEYSIPAGYRYSVDNTFVEFPCNDRTGLSDILHLKFYHPLDDWYGLSPMESARNSIDQHNECIKWNKSLLENGARPTGALVTKESITDEHYDRLKGEIDEKFRGGDNAGKVMLLEGGLDWREIGISPRDMDFIETKNASARDIAIAFGVPSQLLGIKGDTTYNNMAEARISLWEETIIPLLDNIFGYLSNWLSALYGINIHIILDRDSVSAINEKRQQMWNSIENVSFLSINEKRQILGYNSVSGGDTCIALQQASMNQNSTTQSLATDSVVQENTPIDAIISDGIA